MKHLILILSLAFVSTGLAENANGFFKQGEAALQKGDITAAKAAYSQALKLDPSHGDARYRLLSMKNLSAEARVKVRQNKMAAIKLDEVNFEDLSLAESLETLGAMMGKATNDTFVPNFVVEDPEQKLAGNLVNIKLRKIPANVVLKYVLSQAKAREIWSEHVITVRPLSNASAASTAPAE